MSKLTLDEAIKHCLEVAEKEEQFCVQDDRSCLFQKSHAECAADHRQLAEWLTELKEAKRLLRLAFPIINSSRRIDAITNPSTGKKELLKHYILDEALKLIGGSENG